MTLPYMPMGNFELNSDWNLIGNQYFSFYFIYDVIMIGEISKIIVGILFD